MQKRKQFDVKAHRAPTDAAGKGLEDENNFGGRRKAAPAKLAAKPTNQPNAGGKVPKWKLQSM